MILEEETFEAFKYWPKDLKLHSHKLIIAACELCGKFKTIERRKYRTFCKSCSPLLSGRNKGKKSPNFGKRGEETSSYRGGPVKCVCSQCGKEFEVWRNVTKKGGGEYCSRECLYKSRKKRIKLNCLWCKKVFEVYPSRNKNGKRKYCSKKCRDNAKEGENAYNYKGGRKLTYARSDAKRRQQLGYTLLMPLKTGEVGHHVTNEFVIGVPAEVHKRFSGYNRKKHRALILEWLKLNNMKKYEIVESIL